MISLFTPLIIPGWEVKLKSIYFSFCYDILYLYHQWSLTIYYFKILIFLYLKFYYFSQLKKIQGMILVPCYVLKRTSK